MKIYKYQILIIAILAASFSMLQTNFLQREDITYIGQFIILLVGILSIKGNLRLVVSLSFLLVADFLYYLLVYKMGLNTDDKIVAIFSSFSYFFSFNIFAFGLVMQTRNNFFKFFRKKSELFVSIFLMITAFYYILVPGILKLIEHGPTYGHLSNIITLTSSLPLAIIGYVFITNGSKIKNQPLLIGFFILSVLDIGIQLETIKYGNLKFSLYDIFWFLGVFFISYGAKDFSFKNEALNEKMSIVSLVKNIFFISALVTVLIFTTLVNSVVETTPMYSIFIIASIFLFGTALSNLLSSRIKAYNKSIQTILNNHSENEIDSIIENSTLEFSESFFSIYKNISERNYAELENERQRLDQSKKIYRQMAHDIASPLRVLYSISNVDFVDSKSKEMLKEATQRVRTIAEDILNKGNTSNNAIGNQKNVIPIAEVHSVVSNLIKEKKIEFSSKKKFEFLFDPKENIFPNNLKVHGNSKELTRVISNVLNNSIEALPHEKYGQIKVLIEQKIEFIQILISDSGVGFPSSVLAHSFDSPITAGKPFGNGIGLFSAFKTLQKHNGQIEIGNDHGAFVQLRLRILDNKIVEEFKHLDEFLNETT